MPSAKINKSFVDRTRIANGSPKRQELYWDTELKGFGLLVSKSAKAFVIQKAGRRGTLGRYPDLTVAQARKLALQKFGEIAQQRVNPRRGRAQTLRQAAERYEEGMRHRGCTERSIADLNYRLDRYLADWLDHPLTKITRHDVIERHARIGTKNGQYIANGTFRYLRAIYNESMTLDESLPANPAIALRKRWFKERRRREPVGDLRAWWLKVQKMDNHVRRCLQMFILTTGLRSEDARTVRWENVNFEQRTLLRPNPKGGTDRAFTVPLSRFTIGLLRHLRRKNEVLYPNSPWAFPTRDRMRRLTYVKSPKEPRRGLPSPHRLRDTYSTACQEAGLSPYDIDVLTNHRPPSGSVTAGYIMQSAGHMRDCQERVTRRILGSLSVRL